MKKSKPTTPATQQEGGSKIVELKNKSLSQIPALEEHVIELNLQDNKIAIIGTLPKRLKMLKMEGNKIVSMLGVSQCGALELLELSHNQVTKIEVYLSMILNIFRMFPLFPNYESFVSTIMPFQRCTAYLTCEPCKNWSFLIMPSRH